MARILLIEPAVETREKVMRLLASCGSNKANWRFPPLDLMGIAGLFRRHGIEDCEILDALNLGLSHRETQARIVAARPEIVIFTFTVFTASNDMKVATLAKRVSPAIKTLAVNMAAESYPGSVLEDFPDVDFLAYHDPELPALDLVRGGYRPAGVKGIYYRDGGRVIKNPERVLENLDDIGIPAHDKVPLRIYRSPYQRRSPMSATAFSRGCVNMCSHCIGARYLNPLRLRSHESILEELRFLESLGVRELRLFDGEINCDPAWAEELFSRWLSAGIDIAFSCNLRADRVGPRLLRAMARAGCHLVSIGFDSTSQEILDGMNKNETVEQILEAAALIRRYGLRLTTFTTFGHRGETRETMRRTAAAIRSLEPDLASFSIAVPVAGTAFHAYLRENRFLDETAPLAAYDPNLPPVYSYPHLSSGEMYDGAMRAYRSFYLRPSYLLRRLVRTHRLLEDLKDMAFVIRRYLFEPLRRRPRGRRRRRPGLACTGHSPRGIHTPGTAIGRPS